MPAVRALAAEEEQTTCPIHASSTEQFIINKSVNCMRVLSIDELFFVQRANLKSIEMVCKRTEVEEVEEKSNGGLIDARRKFLEMTQNVHSSPYGSSSREQCCVGGSHKKN